MSIHDPAVILSATKEFCERDVAPVASSIDADATFRPDLIRAAGAIGLQSLLFTEEGEVDAGGLQIAQQTTQMIASYCPVVALWITVARLHGYLLSRYAARSVRERYLPGLMTGETFGCFMISEPHAGTDVRAGLTVATRAEDREGWLLNGQKAWIGQSPIADFGIILAKLDSADRSAPTAAFVIDLPDPGFVPGPVQDVAGFRGMPIAFPTLSNVWVPEVNRLDVDGFAGMLEGVNLARLDAAALALGILRSAIRESISFADERVIFGESLSRSPITQAKIGRMWADYLAASALLKRAQLSFAKGDGGDVALISAAKLIASEAAMRHALQAQQIQGGYGLDRTRVVQQLPRDAKVTQIIDGTTEIHELMLGRIAQRQDWGSRP